jgi:hypothetical protein
MPWFVLPIAAGWPVPDSVVNNPWWIAGTLISVRCGIGHDRCAVTPPFWAEVYGVKHLGAIKAVATALMIFASALSPALYGVLFDAGVSVTGIGFGNAIAVLAASAAAWLALRRP